MGATNSVQGLVERYGRFWVEDVPLISGTNWIELTATDPWGNVLMTNFHVVKMDFQLSLDPVAPELLHNATVSLSGTVGGFQLYRLGQRTAGCGDR